MIEPTKRNKGLCGHTRILEDGLCKYKVNPIGVAER